MTIYENYIGFSRDDVKTYKEAKERFRITYPKNFNFAYDVVDELARVSPDKLAMIWLSKDREEKRFTFRDMSLLSNKAANYFTSLGIKRGDRVILVLKRSYYFWVCMLALHKIGAIAIQATNMLMEKDYEYRCKRAQNVAVIITGDGDCAQIFDNAYPSCPSVRLRLIGGRKQREGWLDLEAGIEAASKEWTRRETLSTDVMLMAFSSGTSGYPKMLAHDFTYPLGHICTGVFWHRVVDGGLHFTISDTGWLKSLWGKFYGQWFGESAVLVYDFERFHADDILKTLQDYKVTTFCVPPTMYRLLLQENVKDYDLSSLTHCCSAGEALNPEIFNKWEEATGLEIYEGFGQTETTLCIATLYPFDKPKSGFIGKSALGYDVRVIDENGDEVNQGETGELCIVATRDNRPCGVTIGYVGDDAENERAWKNGYYHTGDTAYTDERGVIAYVGRNDDVIKSSGYRIGPFEVESVLLEHPAVFEVAVTGVPDAVRGFVVKATIVLQQGYSGDDDLIKELQNYVKHHTAPYKYPRIIEFVKELPKTFNGKIRRGAIRENDSKKN